MLDILICYNIATFTEADACICLGYYNLYSNFIICIVVVIACEGVCEVITSLICTIDCCICRSRSCECFAIFTIQGDCRKNVPVTYAVSAIVDFDCFTIVRYINLWNGYGEGCRFYLVVSVLVSISDCVSTCVLNFCGKIFSVCCYSVRVLISCNYTVYSYGFGYAYERYCSCRNCVILVVVTEFISILIKFNVNLCLVYNYGYWNRCSFVVIIFKNYSYFITSFVYGRKRCCLNAIYVIVNTWYRLTSAVCHSTDEVCKFIRTILIGYGYSIILDSILNIDFCRFLVYNYGYDHVVCLIVVIRCFKTEC